MSPLGKLVLVLVMVAGLCALYVGKSLAPGGLEAAKPGADQEKCQRLGLGVAATDSSIQGCRKQAAQEPGRLSDSGTPASRTDSHPADGLQKVESAILNCQRRLPGVSMADSAFNSCMNQLASRIGNCVANKAKLMQKSKSSAGIESMPDAVKKQLMADCIREEAH